MTTAIILVFAITLIAFSFIVIFAKFNYRLEKKKFSFLNMFPYETTTEHSSMGNWIVRGALVFYVVSAAVFAIIALQEYQVILNNVCIASFCITTFLLFPLFLLDLTRYVKVHLLAFLLYGVGTLITSGLLGCLAIIRFADISTIKATLFAIAFFVIDAAVIVVLLNPKITHWAKLDKEVAEDGTITLKRPKYFVLSISQWLLIVANILNLIVLFVFSFFI